jgi:UDP-N-acetylmuramyl pentapeptide phosphotransferase/UDP-N-acetylglucosamine-1-phosphate transferase
MSFVCALALGLFSIPKIIYVAKRKRLLDLPDNQRKLHARVVPNLGGVGIFFAYIIVSSLFIDPISFTKWTYIAAASLVLFVTGIKDDLVEVSPTKKFFSQTIAAIIISFFAHIRLTSFYGVFGIQELPIWFSYAFTILGCVFVTNAFNLIDGIDGLAGSIGVLAAFLLGAVLFAGGHQSEACIAFSLAGGIAGFLWYNVAPARIFMGDTGSLLIGFTLSILCLLTIETYHSDGAAKTLVHSQQGTLILSLSVLFVPLFDTFRVFTTRALKGHSPFKADRTHLHHYLLDLGFSHSQSVVILLIANAFILTVAFLVQDINLYMAIGTMLFVAFGLFAALFILRHRKAVTSALNAKVLATEGSNLNAGPNFASIHFQEKEMNDHGQRPIQLQTTELLEISEEI